jgi:DNA-binding MarR family transcriptional regulator
VVKSPRVVYELAIAEGQAIDTDGIPRAAIEVLKHLSEHGATPIREMMNALSLRRSSVANALTALRKRKLVRSVEKG